MWRSSDNSATLCQLRVEEVQELLFIFPAQAGAHAHVTNDCARYAWGKSFRRIVAARAVLLEYFLTVILCLRSRLYNCSALFVLSVESGKNRRKGKADQEAAKDEMFH